MLQNSRYKTNPIKLNHNEIGIKLYSVINRDRLNQVFINLFDNARSFSKDDRDKFLVLISDGEDLEAEGLKRAKEAHKEGIKIYTIGIGSEEGARIPTDPLNLPA